MPRKTRSRVDPKGTADFLGGAAEKPPKQARKEILEQVSKPNHYQTSRDLVDAGAPPSDTLAEIRGAMLEELGPAALERIKEAMSDTTGKYTPEYQHTLAMKLLDKIGAGKQDERARLNARADLATLRAVSDRLGRILAGAETRTDTHNVAELFG